MGISTETLICTSDGSRTAAELHALQDRDAAPALRVLAADGVAFESCSAWRLEPAGLSQVVRLTLDCDDSVGVAPGQRLLGLSGPLSAADVAAGGLLATCAGMRPLTADQTQVVIGSLLGRGALRKHGAHGAVLRVFYPAAQSGYCEWMARALGTQMQACPGKGNYGAGRVGFATEPFPVVQLRVPSKGSVPPHVTDAMDAKALAVWFMDAGALSRTSYATTLRVGNVDEDTCARLVRRMRELGVEAAYAWRRRAIEIVTVEAGTQALLRLIRPYVHVTMMGKLGNEMTLRDAADAAATSHDHVFRRLANVPTSLRTDGAQLLVEQGVKVGRVLWAAGRFALADEPARPLLGDHGAPAAAQPPAGSYAWDTSPGLLKATTVVRVDGPGTSAAVPCYVVRCARAVVAECGVLLACEPLGA